MSTTTTIRQQFVITFKINNRKTPPQNNCNELMQVGKSQTHTHKTHKQATKPQTNTVTAGACSCKFSHPRLVFSWQCNNISGIFMVFTLF